MSCGTGKSRRRCELQGHGHGVVGLVTDRHGDPAHPELRGAGRRAAMRRTAADRSAIARSRCRARPMPRTPRRAPGDGLLGRPAAGHGLGSAAHVAVLGRRQHATGEPVPEPLERGTDAVDLDDVDAELGHAQQGAVHGIVGSSRRADGSRSVASTFGAVVLGISGRLAAHRSVYSTVTDFARLRGWSTPCPGDAT